MNGKEKGQKYISIGKAANLTWICTTTLRKLADSGKIETYKTPSGHRKFSIDAIYEMSRNMVSSGENSFESKSKEVESDKIEQTNYIYARVSSKKQSDDLERQISFIKERVDSDKFILIQDIGSGINFKRRCLQTILDRCLSKTIGTVVIAHKDRLCRFGFELIESIIIKSGGKLEIINSSIDKSPEQELSEDLLSIIHIFSCRQMERRKYNKKRENEVGKDTAISN